MIDLCTIDDVKLALELSSSDFDADLANRITDVSHRIQEEIDRDLEAQTYVEYHCGGGKWIYVRNPPITSVTSVVVSTNLDFANGETIPSSDYLITNGGWDITHAFRWPGGQDTLKVTYISGHADSTTVPEPLRNATVKQVVFEFQHRKSPGLQTVELADGTITKDQNDNFLTSVFQVLKRYRKAKLG